MTAVAERVAKGAAFLDERTPGWWQRIDLSSLDMDDADQCVFGQVCGPYHESAIEIFGNNWGAPAAHGFNAEGGERTYAEWAFEIAELDAEWRRAIAARTAES